MAVVNEYNSTYKGVINDYQLDISSTTFIGLTDGVIKASSGILSGSSTTSDLPEGTNLYFTNSRFDTRFGTKSTTDLIEGLNLYYTDGRFDTRFALKTTTNLAEGSNLYYTDARSRAALSATGSYLSYNSTSGLITSSITDSIIRGLFSAGSGISYDSSTGVITNTLAGGTVTSITGTANQVLANGTSGSAQTGAITLTLPQSIATSSAVTFGDLTIGTGSTNAELARINANNQAWFAFYTSGLRGGFFGTDTSGGGLLCYADNTSLKLRTGSGPILFYPGSASTESARITDTGLMGVGTNNPQSIFHVSAATGGSGIGILEDKSTGSADIQLQFRSQYGPLANGSKICGNIVGAPSNTGGRLILSTAQNTTGTLTERIRIDDFGYVGIGTGSPEDILHIAKSNSGGVGARIILDNTASPATNNQCEISFLTDSGASGSSYNANIKAVADGSGFGYTALTFGTYGGTSTPSERMRITPAGNVGINTTSPDRKLTIAGGATSRDPMLYLKQSNDYGYSFNIDSFSSGRMVLVGVNAGVETVPLHSYDRSNASVGMGANPTTTGGYPTRLDVHNGGLGASIKVQDSAGSGRGHIQFGSNGTTTYNTLIGCEGNGQFYVWNGVFGTTTEILVATLSGTYIGSGSGTNFLEIKGNDGTLGSYLAIKNNSKTGGNCPTWQIYNMGANYGNGLQFWMYPGSGGAYNPVTFADTGNVTMGYNLTVAGYVSRGSGIVGALSDVSTAFATTTSYAKLTTLATSRLASNTTVSTANNRITVLLAGSYKMSYAGDIYQTSGGDRTVSVVFYKNGSVYSSAAFASTCESGKYAAIVGCDVASLAVNDYIEVWVKIDTNTTVTYNAMMFIVEQI